MTPAVVPAAVPRGASLARRYFGGLAALLMALVSLTLVAALGFVLLPLAQRSADDLAAVMVLSAQTWHELPPETRPAFEDELRQRHGLALQAALPADHREPRLRGFYLHFVEAALARRTGTALRLQEVPSVGATDAADWLWAPLHLGDERLAVGFASERMNTRPLWALGAALAAALLLAAGAAWWMARRIARPIAQLEAAAALLATGARPEPLPETGPRELARLASHFNALARDLQALLLARTTLLAGISHDLRTPLARMRLAVEMQRLRPDEQQLQRIETDIEEMNTLIGQLLALARGFSPEAAQPLNLLPWLHEQVARHAQTAIAAGATLVVHGPEHLTVSAGPAALSRVLDNLLGNALRYAPGPIDICAEAVAGGPNADGPAVRVSVADRGPGIPPEQQQAVWMPFQRLEGSRNMQTGGVGLGLAIVRQLALAQGWRVGLALRDGGGLVAWLDIETRPSADGTTQAANPRATAPPLGERPQPLS